MTASITVAYGDGVGPEIMESTLRILVEARAKIRVETIEIGKAYYQRGVENGIYAQAWESLERTRILLKAPITTPEGGGYQNVNLSLQKSLGLYIDIRPFNSYSPYISAVSDDINLVIINQNNLHKNIEYRQSVNNFTSIEMTIYQDVEKVVNYAFDYAVENNRKKVTYISNDSKSLSNNDVFNLVFNNVSANYPQIESGYCDIDNLIAKTINSPSELDVIVCNNQHGNIISSIVAELCGAKYLAGIANIGDDFALFESAYVKQSIIKEGFANPSGLLNASLMMLEHLGQNSTASTIKNAWLKAIEDKIITAGDINIDEFTNAIIDRLGENPTNFDIVSIDDRENNDIITDKEVSNGNKAIKSLDGIDVFIEWNNEPSILADIISSIDDKPINLDSILSKGIKIWPDCRLAVSRSDVLCCRFIGDMEVTQENIANLLSLLTSKTELNILKTENLYSFDGDNGYYING